MEITDPAHRKGALGKLSHALKLTEALSNDMEAWWNQDPTTFSLELADDEKTVEFVLHTSPLFPAEDWYHRAADILQNYRDALNRLTFTLGRNYGATHKLRNVAFPIRDDKPKWNDWAKKHSVLPEWLLDRFLAFQPYVSGRPYLRALATSNNIEKHEDGFAFVVTITELGLGPGTFRIEGLWDDAKMSEELEFIAGETFDVVSERQVLGSLRLPSRVLDVGAVELDPKFAFTPMMRFDGEEVPLLPALSLIGREVAWAIAYITGLVDSATREPQRLDL